MPGVLTSSQVAEVRDLVMQRYGLFLGEPHERYIEHRIGDRLAELGLSFNQYMEQLRSCPSNAGELQNIVERLCIYETRFMRDPPDFRALACFVVPQLARELRRTGRKRVRAVSAGCSTGQEVYTIAMIFDEAKPELGEAQYEVVGIDLSSDALEKARRARYEAREIEMLDAWRQQRYFNPTAPGQVEVVPWLRERTRFFQANLAGHLPVSQVDVIFCRNVLIYFNPVQRQEVIRNLLAALRLGGYLVVGSADSLWSHRDVLRVMRTSGTLVFQRVRNLPPSQRSAPAEAPVGARSSTHTERSDGQ